MVLMLVLSLVACLKPPQPVLSAVPVPVEVTVPVTVGTERHPANELVHDAIADQVRAHGLVPVDVPTPGAAVLDVALAPRFSSQMAGRYRWTVDVTLTLIGPTDAAGNAGFEQHSTFDVPVALVYAHERELAAADAASPVLVREIGRALDAALSAPAMPQAATP